jgi:sortase A
VKKLSFILILAGILTAAVPVVGQLYTLREQKQLMEGWEAEQQIISLEQPVVNPGEEYLELERVFSDQRHEDEDLEGEEASLQTNQQVNLQTDQPANPQPTGTAKPSKTDTEATPVQSSVPAVKKPVKPKVAQKVLGIMRIDKIKVKSPVVEGVKAENLKVGLGHIPGTSEIGQVGNTAIAGHRSYTFGRFFNRLDELENDDEIVIAAGDKTYTYKVYEKLIVEPSDTSVLSSDDKESILTLITCHPIYIASHRLIIHARLEKTA